MDSYNTYNDIAFKLLTEMAEDQPSEKSSMPEKRAMTFIKEMKGQFKMGEEVDVVKEGSSYNVFKKNVAGGAHPVKLNEKQAEEFFGHKLNEAFAEKIGRAIGAGAKAVGSVVKDVASGVATGVTGKTAGTRAIDASLKKMVGEFKNILNVYGIDRSEQKIEEFLRTQVIRPLVAKYAPGKAEPKAEAPAASKPETATPAAGSETKKKIIDPSTGKPFAEQQDEIDEEGKVKLPAGVPAAKFVDKSALKPKKAKTIGAFRKGKVGSGTSSPKE